MNSKIEKVFLPNFPFNTLNSSRQQIDVGKIIMPDGVG